MNRLRLFKVSQLVKFGLIVGMVAWSGSASSSPATGTSSSPNPDRGLYVYQAYCVGCHGENGTGDGPVAGKLFRDFGIRPSDLTDSAFQESHSNDELELAIVGGGQAVHKTDYMPAWGGALTDRQMGDLVAYLRELKPRASEVLAAIVPVSEQLDLGRVLYTIRCLACHGPSGRGDGPFLDGLTQGGSTLVKMPDFSEYETVANKSDQNFGEILAHGLGHSRLLPEGEQGWWDRPLEKDEMKSLVFYIRSLSLATGKSGH